MAEPLEIVVERDNLQHKMLLEGERVTIGRGAENDVRLDDPLASRVHCRLERLGAEVFVVDLDSNNGTWVDGRRVARRPLALGDAVRVGSTTIHLTGGLTSRLRAAETTQTQETSRERDMLETLLAVMRALHAEENLERMGALLIDAAVSLTRAERGFVFLVQNGRTRLALGRNFAREPVTAPETKLSKTLLEKALHSEEPLLLRDAASEDGFAGVASISDLGLRSLLAIPLRHRGQVLGLLLVDHRLASGAFRQDEVKLLSGLASAAANALGAARDRAALTRTRRRVAALKRQLGQRVTAEQEELRRLGGARSARYGGMVGSSPAMQELFTQIDRVVASDVSVLLQGESGTGKELVAQALHFAGPRAGQAFVTENCGSLPDTLLESELFGHIKGAFTGATRDRAGRFEEADGGTLFLDEVGEMSTAMQARLLRVLQDGEVRRLGSDKVRNVDVRVIAATNSDLAERVREKKFREDLYYRLKVVLLELPPLRRRKGDVPILSEHFLAIEAAEQGRLKRELTPSALTCLEEYPWPGNVRQLRNEMRRVTLLGEGPVEPADLSSEIRHPQASLEAALESDGTLPERLATLEIATIQAAIQDCRGNRSEAARKLGISRFALLRKMEKHGLGPGDD